MTLYELNERAKKIDVNKIIAAIVLNDSGEILKTVKGQLMQGIKGDGAKLKEYQNPDYAAYKKELNPLGVTDLKVTGDFHDAFFLQTDVTFDGMQFEIGSTDDKSEKLSKKYDSDIFELTKENEANYINKELNPQVLEAIQKGLTG